MKKILSVLAVMTLVVSFVFISCEQKKTDEGEATDTEQMEQDETTPADETVAPEDETVAPEEEVAPAGDETMDAEATDETMDEEVPEGEEEIVE